MNQDSPPPIIQPSYPDRLQMLRAECRKAGFDGYLVPMTDEYQNEYIAAPDRRVRFLTGFTGTAGFVAALNDRAAFFTDSRYTLQAEAQLPTGLYELYDISKKSLADWLEDTLLTQMKIGFDPKLHTVRQIERLESVVLKKGAGLVPSAANLVDQIWQDKPPAKIEPFFIHDVTYAGKSSKNKRHEIALELKKRGVSAALVTDPASVAWLLNIRGNDVPFTPLPLSRAIIRADESVEWFVDPRKVTPVVEFGIGPEITRYALDDFPAALKRLGEVQHKVLVDPEKTSFEILSYLRQGGGACEYGDDPCVLPRACKNKTEIDGARAAHRRDGAAMVRFLAWIDENASQGHLTEMDVIEKIDNLRAEGSLFRGLSFATIAGSGPNGAIVHYRANKESARLLDKNSFLLVDSGAQYLDGTTDVTRTIPIGDITHEMKDRYTRVLKGHIAIASIRFPEGTCGADIDVMARQHLWSIGLDYGHGTGHGAGSFLCVHEGPQSISRRGTTPLQVGMILSNEPGYYKARHYGIRLENLQQVIELFEISNTERKMLGFEPLTLVPFDRRAILVDSLSDEEKAWINAYHVRVHRAIRPQLDEVSGQWLAAATAPL